MPAFPGWERTDWLIAVRCKPRTALPRKESCQVPYQILEIRLSGDDQHQQYLTVLLLLIKTLLYSAYIFQSVFINITSFNIITTWVRQGRYYYAQFKDEITEVQRGQMIGLRVYTSGKGLETRSPAF